MLLRTAKACFLLEYIQIDKRIGLSKLEENKPHEKSNKRNRTTPSTNRGIS